MSSARKLYERFRQIIHEGAKFGIVGIAGVIVYNVLIGWLHIRPFHLGPITSATIAFAITAVGNYIANRYWSFRHRERTAVHREFMTFLGLTGVGLLIQVAAVGVTYYELGRTSHLAYYLANNLGIVLGTIFRFWSYRKWVWTERQPALAGHEALEPELVPGPRPAGPAGTAEH